MKTNTELLIACVVFGLLEILCVVVLFIVYYAKEPYDDEAVCQHLLPSQLDIQRELVTMGYLDPNQVDGVIGKISRTAWNEAYFNQCAIKVFERAGVE